MQAAFFVITEGSDGTRAREGLNALLSDTSMIIKQVIPTGFQARHTEELDIVEHGVMVLYEEKVK